MLQPFKSQKEYELSKWLFNYRITKSAVSAYLKDVNIHDEGEQYSFRNGQEWHKLLEQIPWDTPDDKWFQMSFKMDTKIDGLNVEGPKVYYRDIISVLRFLLGHQPFNENLTYAPIKVTNPQGQRVFTEMHTGDWWWSVQGQVGIGSTVVPVLLSSDKTTLTQHHGDLSLWPVYMTIGNLDVQTRRNPSRPAMILLGLIPIIKSGKSIVGDNMNFEIYHTAMGTILQRMYFLKGH